MMSFNFVGTNFHGLTMMGTWICGFQIIRNITKVNKYFVWILNSWIAKPMKNTKLNVQQIKLILQYYMFPLLDWPTKKAATQSMFCSFNSLIIDVVSAGWGVSPWSRRWWTPWRTPTANRRRAMTNPTTARRDWMTRATGRRFRLSHHTLGQLHRRQR